MNNFADILRLIVVVLFGLSLGETGWIVYIYLRITAKTRALLPTHVFMIGLATLLFEVEVITLLNIYRFGEPLAWYAPFNLVAFTLLWISLIIIRRHVTQKSTSQLSNLDETKPTNRRNNGSIN